MDETLQCSLICEEGADPGPPAAEDCCRHKKRTEDERTRLIHRLNRIEGQIRGIRGMIERDAYCPDILVQASAASAALNGFSRELLSQHLRTCVARDLRQGDEESLEETLNILQKLMK